MTREEFLKLTLTVPLIGAAQTMPRRSFFYKPQDAWAGDFIPFYANERYYLFYLQDWRNKEKFGEGTPWYLITTQDFVHFDEHGEMLARGSREEQDLYVFTGSVTRGEGRYHIFYTGHNPYYRKAGKPEQGVMHAVSDDLLHWQKIPEDTFFSPDGKYEPNDWRDPFVFWNEDAKEYWMLLCARLKDGPSRRRGCTALCASKDLRKWQLREPFWTPALYFAHECPDLFKMGDWWYLLFSEFSEASKTRYRMARSLKGPWLTPRDDCFDGRAFYAAKTASDGNRRFLFGWNPTRTGGKDYSAWNWGGNLVVHEVYSERNGSLAVRVPEGVDHEFENPKSLEWNLRATDSFKWQLAGAMPDLCKIEARVDFEKSTRGCGIMLRCSDDAEAGYYVRVEPAANRLVFDSWPRPGDIPFVVELERPLDLSGLSVEIKMIVDGSIGVVYVNDRIGMNVRMYNLTGGSWGVFVNQGAATFRARLSTAR
jgi:beta-fructofuranosidase